MIVVAEEELETPTVSGIGWLDHWKKPAANQPDRNATRLLADIPLERVALTDEIATTATLCALYATKSMTCAVIGANKANYAR